MENPHLISTPSLISQDKDNKNNPKTPPTNFVGFNLDELSKATDDEHIGQRMSKYQKIILECLIDPNEELKEPPVCLWMGGKIFGTLGNFSMIIGKAKSRKTFFITIALAAAASNGKSLNFTASLPEGYDQVLYFDTEQSRYHSAKTVNRVCRLVGSVIPSNFKGYGLRKFQPSKRLKIIKEIIKNTPGLGLVVIDGIRDLVTSINDEVQATKITSQLMKWSEELNIHIIVILHENKADKNPRGHLGTELQNKAETVLSITKDEHLSVVEAVYCRGLDPEPFAFEINSEELPQLVENWQNKSVTKSSKTKAIISDDMHINVLKNVFQRVPQPLYASLVKELKDQFNTDYSLVVPDNKLKAFITKYINEKIISQNPRKANTHRYYILNDNESVVPFKVGQFVGLN